MPCEGTLSKVLATSSQSSTTAGASDIVTEPAQPAEQTPPEVSVVMPCLNEADTLATCIQKAFQAFRDHGIKGEIVIADNGSTDGSQDIAAGMGAIVVPRYRDLFSGGHQSPRRCGGPE